MNADRQDWLRADGDGVVLHLHVQPGAKQSGIAGLHGAALKIRLAAPAVDGKANAALIAFLAACLKVPRARITLLAGHAARAKRLHIAGSSVDQVRSALALPPCRRD